MNEELVSVIVPIYKVEKYLNNCIESIIKQTYKNMQIILIDDGSPDNCGKICDEYKLKDARIEVIHKKNGGLSDARNCGIDMARGKYIVFIDSDDYIDKYYIEKLYMAIKKEGVKLAQCNILRVDDEKNILKKIGYEKKVVKSGKNIIKEQYGVHVIENTVVWNKMYAIELFKDIRFPVGKIHEDEFTTYKILYNLDKVAIIDDYLYYYRENDDSIMKQKFNIRNLDRLDAYKDKMYFFQKRETDIFIKALIRYIEEIKTDYMKAKKYMVNFNEFKDKLLNEYRRVYYLLIKQKKISLKYKIKMFVFYISPNLHIFLKGDNKC